MPPPAAKGGGPAADVVVSVDGVALTQGEIDKHVGRTIAQRGMTGQPESTLAAAKDRMRADLVAGFVARRVLLTEAERQGLAPSPEEVDKALENIRAKLPEGTAPHLSQLWPTKTH